MRHTSAEERIRSRCGLVHVGVEGIAGEVRKMLDVFERDELGAGDNGVAELQVFEMLAERMHAFEPWCTGNPLAGDARQRGG